MPENSESPYSGRLAGFREAVLPASSALILTHDYPDPDSIASAFGLSELLSFWGVPAITIAFGGFVGRAENRAMIRCLGIQTIPFALVEPGDFDRIVLVDCYPGRGNITLPPGLKADAVIDHHPASPPNPLPFFCDIRSNYGAAATIITNYLTEAGCQISATLATALFNGIKTDTSGLQRNATPDDIECYKRLFYLMDHSLLAQIESPGRDMEFFRTIHKAAESAVCRGNVGYCHLGTVAAPDSIAEMAEFFHSLEKLEWMVCTAVFNSQIYFSIRSENDNSAGIRAEQLAERFGGSGGGHTKAAAGRIPIDDNIDTMLEKIVSFIENIFGVAGIAAEPLL
ncbi:MAG: bifunctional oligoribonuclease/PAP phosphatase NrnA [Chitinispirillia bacterium]|nr:bifunctional oligoribonuclease/PAP phosphatase NrnA [Chitinispirillia bacterium]MCL2268059.1 bifunctional oligoribonuclease/PAP phosphatase NrnA [Chitinispirillia bacterium]